MSNRIERDLFGRLEEVCRIAPIEDLLRKYKNEHGQSSVRITGRNKAETIHNLREAVEGNFIPRHEVENLVRDAEENGDQRIYLFRPKSPDVSQLVSSFISVRSKLFGMADDGLSRFPAFNLANEGFVWGDFREEGQLRGRGWRGKVYGHEVRWARCGEPRVDGEMMYVPYKHQVDMPVLVARWNGAGFLEMRVPRVDSERQATKYLATLWEFFSPAFKLADFEPWEMGCIRKRLLSESADHANVYAVNRTELLDSSSGTAIISPQTLEEAIDDLDVRGEAIGLYLRGNAECPQLAVTWLDRDDMLGGDLPTAMGGILTNLIIFRRAASREAVDYVIDQVRGFEPAQA